MKRTFEVTIDISSKSFTVEAESVEEAETKALNMFIDLPTAERVDEFWVGDIHETTENISIKWKGGT